MEISIEISPFNCDYWYISYEDSYRFSTKEGTIYTFRFYSRSDCDNLENRPNFYDHVAKSVDHECLHKILLDLEGYQASKLFDNVL